MESKADSDTVSRNTALSCCCCCPGLAAIRDGLGGRSLQSGGRDPAGGPGLGLRTP